MAHTLHPTRLTPHPSLTPCTNSPNTPLPAPLNPLRRPAPSTHTPYLQENNAIVKTFGEPRILSGGEKLYNHVDLVQLLGIVNMEAGAEVSRRCVLRAGPGESWTGSAAAVHKLQRVGNAGR